MVSVTINKKLNLVIPIEDGDKIKAWIHCTPLSREVFESNYLLLIKTLSFLYANGIGPLMAIRIAKLALRDVAKEMDDTTDLSVNVMNEIYRLTLILMPDNFGRWTSAPYLVVKSKNLLDEEKLREVENALVYFTVASAVHLQDELPMAYQGLKQIWKAQTTSSNDTEYSSSLPISTPAESIGEKTPEIFQRVAGQRASLIPS